MLCSDAGFERGAVDLLNSEARAIFAGLREREDGARVVHLRVGADDGAAEPADRFLLAQIERRHLVRVRRIRGQVDAIERALDSEQECAGILQLMAACRGALNGLMAEVMEGHIRFHVLSPDSAKTSPQAEAAEELIDVVRAYLK